MGGGGQGYRPGHRPLRLLPWTIDGQDEVEVAYLLGRDWWGRGLGSEAALAIRGYAFWTLGLTRLVCLIADGNVASVKVAERIGMAFERDRTS